MGGRLRVRVAFDASVLGSKRGGDETLLKGLLVGLADVTGGSGASFPLLLRDAPDACVPRPLVGDPSFPVYRLPRRARALRYAYDIPRLLSRTDMHVDLLYSQTHAPLAGPVASILQLTDLSFHHHPRLYPPLTRLRLNLLVPLHARRARAVLVISEFTRRDVIETYRIPAERVFLVPCGIDPPPPEPERDQDELDRWLSGYGIRRPYFVYVGNLHPRKNLRRLVEAFDLARRSNQRLSQFQLVVVGTEHRFYPRLWAPAEASAMQARAHNAVVTVGHVSDAERDRLVGHAAALTYPSLFEGFGLPPVEAMAVGTPVLAANTAALPEVLGDAALLVDPFDVDAIARGLVSLATDPHLVCTLRERGRERAARYSTRLSAERALEAFESALSGTSPRRPSTPPLARSAGSQSRSMPGSSAIRFVRRNTAASHRVTGITDIRPLRFMSRTLCASSATAILDGN